ncbi:hypothetical protein, conserved [Plasmodium gonderi]|uniref:Uncharacterized protein n=1 Tax=Plasmodium gonderi TaxID=77519 RepID=A0A1Y1JMR0_PLAGO|nr:hypothetical protein, conserved [Plasmodium gonderi]GAW83769.1 hypothetical protein, conserved [Plasmodium gonderi]
MKIVAFANIFLMFIMYIKCMDPKKKGNENFPARNSTNEETNFDSAYPAFNIHYNIEPKDWKYIELVEKEKNDFLVDIKNEIILMEEDKMKINYVLNIQKQQLEELQFQINHIKHMIKKSHIGNDQKEGDMDVDVMPQYLRNGNFVTNKFDGKKILETFNELNNYTLNKYKLTNQGSFYHNLAEQWIS